MQTQKPCQQKEIDHTPPTQGNFVKIWNYRPTALKFQSRR